MDNDMVLEPLKSQGNELLQLLESLDCFFSEKGFSVLNELGVLHSMLADLQVLFEEGVNFFIHHLIDWLDVVIAHTLFGSFFPSTLVSFRIKFVCLFACLANSSLALRAVFHDVVVLYLVFWPSPSVLRIFLLLMRPASKNAFWVLDKEVFLGCGYLLLSQFH